MRLSRINQILLLKRFRPCQSMLCALPKHMIVRDPDRIPAGLEPDVTRIWAQSG